MGNLGTWYGKYFLENIAYLDMIYVIATAAGAAIVYVLHDEPITEILVLSTHTIAFAVIKALACHFESLLDQFIFISWLY